MFNKLKCRKDSEEFYRVIENHLNHGFCVTANIPNYRSLINRYEFPQSLIKADVLKKLFDPHFFMYQTFFELSIYEKEKLGLSGPIDFIFDKTKKYEYLITEAFKYTLYSAQKLGISKEAFGALPSFQDDKIVKPLQAADLLARLIRTTTVKGVPWDGSQMPWKKQKPVYILNADLDEKYFLGRLDTAFSKENLEIYSQYTPTNPSNLPTDP